MAYLQIEDLTVSYGRFVALEAFSLEADEGDRVVVLGPSGSGKTTLLMGICGLVPLRSGRVSVRGRRIDGLPPGARGVAMVFQDGALFPHLTARQNIELPLRAARLPRGEREARVARISRLLCIEALLDRRPQAMSGGERQRVALARALVRQPDLFLFDEPFGSLDPPMRHALAQEVLDIHRTVGVPFLHVTHDQMEALSLATRVVVIKDGRVRQIGTPAEVYDAPADLFVAGFVGSPRMNLLPLAELPPELRNELPRLPALPAHDVVVGFRPEDVHLKPGGGARLVSRQVHGPDQVLTFELAPCRVVARMKREKPLEGEGFRLVVPHGKVHFFDAATGRRIG